MAASASSARWRAARRMADDAEQATPPLRSCGGNMLAHGVVGGDPNGPHVPRCGAKTRPARGGAPCRGPAMRNGRCRLHGGWSRGPVTSEGKAKAAAANLKHGAYSSASIGMRAALRRSRAEAEELVAELVAEAQRAVDAAEDANTGVKNARR
jgi:hypothetical protein